MSDIALIIGACGQIGVELTRELQRRLGDDNVIATDLAETACSQDVRYERLDVLDRRALRAVVEHHRISQIYLLAAALSARGEQNPDWAWDLNMKGLLNVLGTAVDTGVKRVFWPSSIAAFGPSTPRAPAPQTGIMDPTTIYGISKLAGERWCEWYHRTHGLDVRSLRFPGLLSTSAPPGGGTTDYAIHMMHAARRGEAYECFLARDRRLPMMDMSDAVRATVELMNAPADRIRQRGSYNIAAVSFTPEELASLLRQHVPDFTVTYRPDFRDGIAASWPESLDDSAAREDWGWQARHDVASIIETMLAEAPIPA